MTTLLGYTKEWLEEKNGFHTANEISHQPRLWQELAKALNENQQMHLAFLNPILSKPNVRVVLTGAGTSAFTGEAIAPYLRKVTGLVVDAVATTDIVSNPEQFLVADQPTLMVSFARSGNSPESVAAVAIANQVVEDCSHLFLTCNPNGELAKYAPQSSNAHSIIMPEGSNDQSFAMTSSFTSMMLAAIGLITQSINEDFEQKVNHVAEICQSKLSQWRPLIKELAALDYQRLIVLGSGGFSGLSREASLKSLELSAGKVMTTYDSSLGFRHGPKFTVNEKALVIQFLSSDPYTRQYDQDLFNELTQDAIAARVIALSENTPTSSDMIEVGEVNGEDIWLSFPYILFAQMLSFEKSLELGFGPDNPCPSGEVNRVVQGVTIYNYKK